MKFLKRILRFLGINLHKYTNVPIEELRQNSIFSSEVIGISTRWK
jgi:hypothetical protein